MDDLISRQAAIESLKEERCPCESDYDEGYLSMLDKAIWIIQEWLPSVQPRTGKWIEHDDDWANVYYECSVCKEPFVLIDGTPAENLYNFCPNCGADMRGEQDE